MISVVLFLYGDCYIRKNGTDELPTYSEFTGYLNDKKEEVICTYDTIQEWVLNQVSKL